VGPRQDADVDRDLAQLRDAAAVHPDPLVERELTSGLLLDEAEQALADACVAAGSLEQRLAVAAGAVGPERVGDRLAQGLEPAGRSLPNQISRLAVASASGRPGAPGRARCRRSSTASGSL
jgi:hypothetical protein